MSDLIAFDIMDESKIESLWIDKSYDMNLVYDEFAHSKFICGVDNRNAKQYPFYVVIKLRNTNVCDLANKSNVRLIISSCVETNAHGSIHNINKTTMAEFPLSFLYKYCDYVTCDNSISIRMPDNLFCKYVKGFVASNTSF